MGCVSLDRSSLGVQSQAVQSADCLDLYGGAFLQIEIRLGVQSQAVQSADCLGVSFSR